MKTLDHQQTPPMTQRSPQSVATLPPDHERPPVSSFFRETVSIALRPELYARFKRSDWGVPPFVVILAAVNIVLHRYTENADISVGAVIQTDHASTDLVVIRTRVSAELGAKDLIRQIAATIEKPAARSMNGTETPPFRVAFDFSPSTAERNGMSSKYGDELARCDLVFHLEEEQSGGVTIHCDYDSELYDSSTIERFLQHWMILLEGIAADPDSKPGRLPLLSQRELHRIFVEWNNTRTDFHNEVCIHRLFEEQVERTPDATAVIFKGKKLTYRQLNARANQLAHRLRGLGVGPDVLVGICVERSIEMMVGLLAILKAGGAYVPLDPNYPRERLAYMLTDSNAQVILTQQRLVNDLPKHSATVVRLDSPDPETMRSPQENLGGGSTAENLAYVIYTSLPLAAAHVIKSLTDTRQRAESAIVATLKRIRKSQRHAGSAEHVVQCQRSADLSVRLRRRWTHIPLCKARCVGNGRLCRCTSDKQG
jgi:non-ribosomal peptide synthetase component F